MKNKLSSKTWQTIIALVLMGALVVMGIVILITRASNKSTAEWAIKALDAGAGEDYLYKVDEKDVTFGPNTEHYKLYSIPGKNKYVLIHFLPHSDNLLRAVVYDHSSIKVKNRVVLGGPLTHPYVNSEDVV